MLSDYNITNLISNDFDYLQKMFYFKVLNVNVKTIFYMACHAVLYTVNDHATAS